MQLRSAKSSYSNIIYHIRTTRIRSSAWNQSTPLSTQQHTLFFLLVLRIEDGKDDQKVFRRPPATNRFGLDLDGGRALDVAGSRHDHVGRNFFRIVRSVVLDNDIVDKGCASLIVGVHQTNLGTCQGSCKHGHFQFLTGTNFVLGRPTATARVNECSTSTGGTILVRKWCFLNQRTLTKKKILQNTILTAST